MDALLDRGPWYVVGPLIGLVVIAAFALLNERVGVVGGFSDVVARTTGRSRALGWKAWFVVGIVAGGLAFRVLAGAPTVRDGYGWLTRELAGPVVGIVLVVAGIAIGFGAKQAGGCTSGNGLNCATGSASNIAATATFLVTAIAVAFGIEAIT
jgi:hypothetical protein